MKLRTDLRGKTAFFSDFVQNAPKDGVPATEKTEVYLAYDQARIYIVILCFDSEPDKIRGYLSKRDDIGMGEDWVEVYLDTYNDQRHAYNFTLNPRGVQWDARFSETDQTVSQGGFQGFQPSFDALWDSRGVLTDQGYALWMSIPFRSIRFSSQAEQTWRIIVGRYIPRKNEYSSYPHVSKDIKGTLNQSALLKGLHDISPGKNMQILPYASFRSFRLLDSSLDPPAYLKDTSDPSGGVDGKIVIRDNSVLDATYNPDFSQVESDQPQVTINQRFEVFFPEKRPFFQENAQYFDTPIDLVFTRRIADPQYGVRLTGKYGPYTLGTLVTNDEAPGKQVDQSDPLWGKNALFGIARITRDIATQSTLGMLVTSRELDGHFNNVASADSLFRFGSNWQSLLQAAWSSTDTVGESPFTGTAYLGSLTRTSRHFQLGLSYKDISPDFLTLSGFVPRTDIRNGGASVSYTFRPEKRSLLSWGPGLVTDYVWDHNGVQLNALSTASLRFEWIGSTDLILSSSYMEETLRPIDFPVLEVNKTFAEPSAQVEFDSSAWNRLSLTGTFTAGKAVNYEPPVGQPPALADSISASLTGKIRPFVSVELDPTYFYTALRDPGSSSRIFDNHILRIRCNWQISPPLSVRVIVQYEATIPNAGFTSLQEQRNLNGDLLITYMVNPWTALYIGYNRNYRNVELLESSPFPRIALTGSRLANDANQFFMKFSYLIHF